MSHYEDEEQVEALKKWWQENWKALAAGLVLGVGSILGWEGWQTHQQSTAADASRIYAELQEALTGEQLEAADELAARLKTDFSGTPYAAHAVLAVAAHLAEHGDFEAASERLNWVVQRSDDEGLRHIARLRRARALWQLSRVDEALKLLNIDQAGSFTGLYAELRGDIRLSSGDRKAARADYEAAMAALPPEAANRELLQRKLDDLADVVSS